MAEFLAGHIEQAESYVRKALLSHEGHPSALMTGVGTAALLGLEQELAERKARFLKIYPDGLANVSVRSLPFERQECRERYFAAARQGGLPG